jgi:hypothetical protein
MKMLNVFYYHYYQFYTRVIPDDQPNATVIFVLSFVEALLINAIIDYAMLKLFCVGMSKWPMISVIVIMLVVNYFYYYRSGRFTTIIEEKPMLFDSRKLSATITFGVSLLIISWMFWGAVLGKHLLENCQ